VLRFRIVSVGGVHKLGFRIQGLGLEVWGLGARKKGDLVPVQLVFRSS